MQSAERYNQKAKFTRHANCIRVRQISPDVALFFGGWPIFAYAPEEGATRTTQKWGFFRALQLQTGANSYAATSRQSHSFSVAFNW